MFPYSLRLPYTLTISAIVGKMASGGNKHGFVAEFDCKLEVDYEDPDNWEISGIRMEQVSFCDEFHVTPKSDPALWALIDRALTLDDKAIEARVIERMHDDLETRQDQRGDDAYDRMVEYRS